MPNGAQIPFSFIAFNENSTQIKILQFPPRGFFLNFIANPNLGVKISQRHPKIKKIKFCGDHGRAIESVGFITGPLYKTIALLNKSIIHFGGVGRNAGPPYKPKWLSPGELYRGESPWRSPGDFMAPFSLSGSVSGNISTDRGMGIPEVEHTNNEIKINNNQGASRVWEEINKKFKKDKLCIPEKFCFSENKINNNKCDQLVLRNRVSESESESESPKSPGSSEEQKEGKWQILLKSPEGQTRCKLIDQKLSVLQLKELVSKWYGYSIGDTRLVCKQRELYDKELLFREKSEIQIKLKLKGGMKSFASNESMDQFIEMNNHKAKHSKILTKRSTTRLSEKEIDVESCYMQPQILEDRDYNPYLPIEELLLPFEDSTRQGLMQSFYTLSKNDSLLLEKANKVDSKIHILDQNMDIELTNIYNFLTNISSWGNLINQNLFYLNSVLNNSFLQTENCKKLEMLESHNISLTEVINELKIQTNNHIQLLNQDQSMFKSNMELILNHRITEINNEMKINFNKTEAELATKFDEMKNGFTNQIESILSQKIQEMDQRLTKQKDSNDSFITKMERDINGANDFIHKRMSDQEALNLKIRQDILNLNQESNILSNKLNDNTKFLYHGEKLAILDNQVKEIQNWKIEQKFENMKVDIKNLQNTSKETQKQLANIPQTIDQESSKTIELIVPQINKIKQDIKILNEGKLDLQKDFDMKFIHYQQSQKNLINDIENLKNSCLPLNETLMKQQQEQNSKITEIIQAYGRIHMQIEHNEEKRKLNEGEIRSLSDTVNKKSLYYEVNYSEINQGIQKLQKDTNNKIQSSENKLIEIWSEELKKFQNSTKETQNESLINLKNLKVELSRQNNDLDNSFNKQIREIDNAIKKQSKNDLNLMNEEITKLFKLSNERISNIEIMKEKFTQISDKTVTQIENMSVDLKSNLNKQILDIESRIKSRYPQEQEMSHLNEYKSTLDEIKNYQRKIEQNIKEEIFNNKIKEMETVKNEMEILKSRMRDDPVSKESYKQILINLHNLEDRIQIAELKMETNKQEILRLCRDEENFNKNSSLHFKSSIEQLEKELQKYKEYQVLNNKDNLEKQIQQINNKIQEFIPHLNKFVLEEKYNKIENDLKSLRDMVEMKQNQYESIKEMILITEKTLNDTLTDKTMTIQNQILATAAQQNKKEINFSNLDVKIAFMQKELEIIKEQLKNREENSSIIHEELPKKTNQNQTLNKWLNNNADEIKNPSNFNSKSLAPHDKEADCENDKEGCKEKSDKPKQRRKTNHNCIEKGCLPCIDHTVKIKDLDKKFQATEASLKESKEIIDKLINQIKNMDSKPASNKDENKMVQAELNTVKHPLHNNDILHLGGITRPKFKPFCYANAALQLLFSIQSFTDILRELKFTTKNQKATLLKEIQNIYECISTRSKNCNAQKVIEIIQRYNNIQDNRYLYYQQDSSEFLENMINMILEEINQYYPTINTKIDFIIALSHQETSKGCNHIWKENSDEILLKLKPYLKPSPRNLPKLFENNFNLELQDICKICSRKTNKSPKKQTYPSHKISRKRIINPSKYFFINIERNFFDNQSKEICKFSNKIHVPSQLNIKQWIEGITREDIKYNLIGAIIHKGTSSGGHYTTLKKVKEEQWTIYDDQQTRNIRDIEAIEEICKSGVCLLFKQEEPNLIPHNEEIGSINPDNHIINETGNHTELKTYFKLRRHHPEYTEYVIYTPKSIQNQEFISATKNELRIYREKLPLRSTQH